ncbi:hypothetical protein [Selenomonas ruminantium]|uniref:hypothetical protein n=1 Tax=Selenomonas ruminantium TaxID=971 RepID=UPI0026F2587C|nr:hypothetical protein [Selenomonas ruminantium]
MGILRKGTGHLTPVHKNSNDSNDKVKKSGDKPFYWDSVKHSEYGEDMGAPVKTIKLSKEEIDRLYPRTGKTITFDEMNEMVEKGMTASDISKCSGLTNEEIREISRTYGVAGRLYQNSTD